MAYITGSATNISKPISTNSPSVSTGGSIRSTPSAPYSASRATSPHRLTQNSIREIGNTPHVVAVGDNRIGMDDTSGRQRQLCQAAKGNPGFEPGGRPQAEGGFRALRD